MKTDIRNIAIIAHVDHGKTTLVDALLTQSDTKLHKDAGSELIMDSNELERERGITIFSKNAAITWQGHKINIIDTPGHADFGGEVERVLKMADGYLLLVDAKEGPMPQTRFVLKKALELGHRVIVVINKIDKPDARPDYALNKTFDLFIELGASDHLTDFPIVYASAKQGLAGLTPTIADMKDITPLFATILKEVPPPTGEAAAPLQFLATSITANDFKGRIATGRVHNGKLTAGERVNLINRQGVITPYRLSSLMTYVGLDRVEVPEVLAGDIAAIAGIPEIDIGETVADIDNPMALPTLHIEEPTVKINILVNDSPLAGTEGKYVTSRQINERLNKELETDMALRVEPRGEGGWTVSGRGELHLAILLERMRRDGYEVQVSRPQVITKEVDGQTLVPWEDVHIEVPDVSSGAVIAKLSARHAQLQNMHTENNITFLHFLIPTYGLFGYKGEFMIDTKGLGIINSIFADYRPDSGAWPERDRGSLVAHESGTTALYSLLNAQQRGRLFFGPGVVVYQGQVVGQHAREKDLVVNVCKGKQLTNMRSKGEGSDEHFDAPKIMELEDALEYIGDDELVEITPQSIRLRKKILNAADERRKTMGQRQ
ncbi:translational GTPase TypA [Candidatus Falkowbacteria bacterium]|nr:translational GTPase TypA [Candidatus Falkowbacteria bacterium]